jgi:hypothetical protein
MKISLQRRSARKTKDVWCSGQFIQLSSYTLSLFLFLLVNGFWNLVFLVSVGDSLLCYILACWSGCWGWMMKLGTFILWLFINKILALLYVFGWCWMSSIKKLLKWDGDDGEEWCSFLNDQIVTYFYSLCLPLISLLHTGYVELFYSQSPYQWIHIEILIWETRKFFAGISEASIPDRSGQL